MWVECGQPAADFWESCGQEMRAIVTGAVARMRRERNLVMSGAWHAAWLTAYAPVNSKDFTPHDRMVSDARRPEGRRDWQQSFAAFSAWAGSRKG